MTSATRTAETDSPRPVLANPRTQRSRDPRRTNVVAVAVVEIEIEIEIEYSDDYDHDNDNEPSLRPGCLTPASPDWDQRKTRYRSPAAGSGGPSDTRSATEEPAEKVVA